MPWANCVERYVDIFKNSTKKDFKASNEPLVLWCYCFERQYKIINATEHDNFHLNGQTPHTVMTGHPTDLSTICEFLWYYCCYYWCLSAKFPSPANHLDIVLGQSKHAETSIVSVQ